VKRRLAWVWLVLSVATACRTTPPDVIVDTGGEEQRTAAIDVLSGRLLDLTLAPDKDRLSELETELERAAGRPGSSRVDRAILSALQAEAALLAGDLAAARRLAEAGAALSDTVEGVWIVRAATEPDSARRLRILEEGVDRARTKSRLLCERGRLLMTVGRYAEAAQDLDEGLRGLDPRYRALYGADRDKALSLAQAVREAGPSAAITQADAMEGPLTVRGMVERAFTETRLLSSLSSEASPSYASVLPALRRAELLLDPSAPPGAQALRKTVAFFLWGIVARSEHDPVLLTRYRAKYSSSPVPDVGVRDPWFDAVLGVVERELMDLPDGLQFLPEEPVTGLEYLSVLRRLGRLYP
jgi:tetratricopeptide (TPR) repeat protein